MTCQHILFWTSLSINKIGLGTLCALAFEDLVHHLAQLWTFCAIFFYFCLLLFPVQCAQSWIEITQMRFLFFVKDEANDLYTVSMLNIQDHSGHFLISLIELRNTIPRSFTMFHTVRRLRNASKPQKQFNGACELDTDDQEIQICDHTRHVNHEHRIFISDEFYKTRASAWL